jgi:endonuclease/exonuclease/phosphatase family metal-dependent hydrolase
MPDVRAIAWNVFHGRDDPPDRGLVTWRSRLLRVTERNATHVQVNRPLLREFGDVLAAADWSVCLLQEVPLPWAEPLAERCGAEAHSVPTSRNQLGSLRRRLADWNPDLMRSWEGGSNVTLVRRGWRVVKRNAVLLNPLPRRGRRERRWMVLTALTTDGGAELCVGNLHATANRAHAEADVRRGAERALQFAGDRPLIFGGDLNLSPRSSRIFEELESGCGLAPPTAGDAIDHLLARGLEVVEPPHPWAPDRRELVLREPGTGVLRLRLSDHAPVEAAFAISRPLAH